ncbi:TIGR03621 family F420-dependent LLM class oxidoreductase [Nocardiopsis xinjiangensis]|uniref:TIGR03621 family F420-dependent LLM class oxidoreductase n=1 Tax=Nocardiopsis xinjiangensis TaxID=124285 RepID=UPI000369BAA2|nr:TIGR03621 family F420-dependent LLM class oxidoreductase [Nocardiopsis xinjiangensis]
MRPFRFGVNAPLDAPATWADTCRTIEGEGFDLLLCPDHLGAPSPFAYLAAAAQVTTRLRLGTYVLNNEFWNPALLAREAATVDLVSGGRLELGLGAGHMKSEFDDADLPWRPHAERVARLGEGLAELDTRLREGGQEPGPAQRPRPPFLVGGHGPATLDLAARWADTVAFSGLTQRPEAEPGQFSVADSARTLERVERVRAATGERSPEFGVLLQAVRVTDDVEATAAELVDLFGADAVPRDEPLWDNPFVLLGTAEEMARILRERRERFGFTHVVTHASSREDLAQVIPLVRGEE